MLTLTRPPDQDHFNAAVFELISLNVSGEVYLPGVWDSYNTLEYLEKRLRISLIATLHEDGSVFSVRGKLVQFTDESVIISTSRTGCYCYEDMPSTHLLFQ